MNVDFQIYNIFLRSMQSKFSHQVQTVKFYNGNQIPIIGYGTYDLGGQDCQNGLEDALKAGYVHIDTASYYKNQTQIKNVLKKSNFPRQKLFITSKTFANEQGYNEARQACLRIIEKLDCGYLDLLLVHWPFAIQLSRDDPKNAELRLQTWKAFIQLKKEGKVKDIGVSNFTKGHLQHLFKNSTEKPVVNQIQTHPLYWQGQIIDFCRQNNIVIQAYSPLSKGHQKLLQNQVLKDLSEKYKKSIAQLSLRFLIQEGIVVLPKSKSKHRLEQNINVFDFQISAQDVLKIRQLRKINLSVMPEGWRPQCTKY